MKLTKARFQKIWRTNKKTKKNFKKTKRLKHTNTYRKKTPLNLKNKTLKKH